MKALHEASNRREQHPDLFWSICSQILTLSYGSQTYEGPGRYGHVRVTARVQVRSSFLREE